MASDEVPPRVQFPLQVQRIVSAITGTTPDSDATVYLDQVIPVVLFSVPFLVAEVFKQATPEQWASFSVMLGDLVDGMWAICDADNPPEALALSVSRGFDAKFSKVEANRLADEIELIDRPVTKKHEVH